jgi:hypothetical protein
MPHTTDSAKARLANDKKTQESIIFTSPTALDTNVDEQNSLAPTHRSRTYVLGLCDRGAEVLCITSNLRSVIHDQTLVIGKTLVKVGLAQKIRHGALNANETATLFPLAVKIDGPTGRHLRLDALRDLSAASNAPALPAGRSA